MTAQLDRHDTVIQHLFKDMPLDVDYVLPQDC